MTCLLRPSLAVCLALFALAAPARMLAGQVSVTVTTNFYVVKGTNFPEVRASMTQERPWKFTNSYDAQTRWNVRSDFTWRRADDQFVLNSFQVTTKVVITLPCWAPGKPVEAGLSAQWDSYLSALRKHEQGHLELAREATAEVQRRLQLVPAFPTPKELAAAANRVATETVAEFRQRDAKYDEQTGHGVTQGAVFLPRGRPPPPPPPQRAPGL